jgi:hypothetical protein
MKHKLITFFFLIALGFSFNLITPTDSKAIAFGCAKNADGAIIVQRLSANFFDLTDGTASDQCSEEPDFYKVLIYKIALCKEDPYTAGGSALLNYDTCVVLMDDFTKTDSDATVIQPGIEANLPIAAQTIPVGTYPFASLVVNSKIRVKHNQTYVYKAGLGTNKGLRGFEAIAGDDNDDLGNGEFNTFCWSLAKVTTLHNDAYSANAAYPVAHGLGTSTAVIEPQADQATSTMQCGQTAGTAAYATEIIDDMRDGDSDPFAAHMDYDENDVVEDTGVAGIEMAALLLEDEATISTGLTKSKLINVVYKYTNPVVISEQTIGLNIRIKTSSAISLDYSWDNTNKVMWGSKVGANAFTTKFLTKTRRARGAWR